MEGERILATSEISGKFVTTIPLRVRRILEVESGDVLVWIGRERITGGRAEMEIIVRKG